MAGGRWPWPWPVVGGLAGWPGRGRGSGRWPVAGGRWPGHWPWPWQPGRGRGRWPVAVSVAGPWPWPGWPATKKSYCDSSEFLGQEELQSRMGEVNHRLGEARHQPFLDGVESRVWQQKWITPLKTNMETQNDGLEKVTPFKHGNCWYLS